MAETEATKPPVNPLVVRDVHKRYKDGTVANRGISLWANPGETLGILGPNGAGKTTLVRQITTELLPTSGEIQVFGLDVVREPQEVKALLGVMPQGATLYDALTVYQHFRIFGRLRGLTAKKAARRADELIAELRLTEHRDRPVDKLSGGLQRRALVGIASLAKAPLLVLDEPTTGLDPQSRHDLWSLLGHYKEEGTTVLLTTHYMEEAEVLCDRVGIINQGRLLALDTVDNLRASHGFEFKITFQRDDSGMPESLYGSTGSELTEKVRAMGIQQYTVARASLEDVYLALTGEREALDD